LQVRQVGQDFFRGFETRSAGHFDMDAEFLGDADRKSRLAESGRSVEQDVPEGVLAFIGRIDGDFQNLHDFSLADHFADPLGAQDRVVFRAGRAESEGFAWVDFTWPGLVRVYLVRVGMVLVAQIGLRFERNVGRVAWNSLLSGALAGLFSGLLGMVAWPNFSLAHHFLKP